MERKSNTHDCYKQIEAPAMTHIEACPVCGSAGQLWRYSESPDSPTTTVVMCSNGDKLGPQQGIVNEGCYLYIPTENAHRATIREAVKYWNEYAKALIAVRVKNAMPHPLTFERRGDGMHFSIGVQSFKLAYDPETDEEFHWMADMLTKAISRVDQNFETEFQRQTVEIVMEHIDRMNDICPDVDPAERIIESFTSHFDPLLQAYWAKKFPGRLRLRKDDKPIDGYQHDSHSAEHLAAVLGLDEEYELHQNDECVAGTSGKNALSEIMNYARQYSQDGPVEIFKVTRTKINPDPLGIRAALEDDINEIMGARDAKPE